MAATPPFGPSDFKSLIPTAGSSWCSKMLALPGRLAVEVYQMVRWAMNDDFSATTELKAWLGVSTSDITVPQNLTATDGTSDTSVTVSWTAAAGATSYQIFRAITNDSAVAAVIGSSVTTSYTDSSVTLGQVYFYWAKAVGNTGTSAFSNGDSGFSQVGSGAGSQTFLASDTFVVPAGITSIDIEQWAGGGGGGGRGRPPFGLPGTFFAAGGGGGGAFGSATIAVTPAETLTITIGAAAAGGGESTAGVNGSPVAVSRSTTVLLSSGGGFGGGSDDGGDGAGGAGGAVGTDSSATAVVHTAGNAGAAGSGATGGAGGTTSPVSAGSGTGGNGSGTASEAATAGLVGKIILTW